MNEQRSLLIGFDLSAKYTQISCFNQKNLEPESICITSDKTKYLIPTVLGVKNDTKDWIFGEDAIECNKAGTAELVDELLMRIENKQETEIFGVRFEPIILLEKFIRKCLHILKIYYPLNSIQLIVVTLKEKNEILADGIYKALENLGIGKDRARVQSHSQSYQYYALSQSKDLWMNDVGLFDYDEDGLKYHQITINRKIHPFVVGVVDKDFSQTLSYKMLEGSVSGEKLEYIFENIANSILHKQIVSTIYITGKGFEGKWADNSLKELCAGRRVFKGQNLFTKGACYAARELSGEHNLDGFLFYSNEMITSTLLISGYYNATHSEVVLAKAATPWYEIDHKMDLILDDVQEIELIIKNAVKGETTKYNMKLDGLPQRPKRTTRIEIRVKFLNKITALITVKDKGFGDLYPTTNRIWEKEISI